MRTLAKTGDPGDSASPCAMAAIEDLQLLTVILTAQCNLRCRYCFQDAKRARSLSWDNLRAALDLVVGSRQPVVHVLFTGGEPLLEFAKLRRAVAYLRQHCGEHRRFIFGLNTNGVLLTEEIVEFLARHRFHLQLSFDGVARAQDFRVAALSRCSTGFSRACAAPDPISIARTSRSASRRRRRH